MLHATKKKKIVLAGTGSAILAMAFSTTSIAEDKAADSWWDSTKMRAENIVNEGEWDLYVSGYAHHSRSTYSDKRIKKFNEKAWGLGIGKTLRNTKGNDESLYIMVNKDSRRHAQWMAGYAYQWMFPINENGLEAGAGLTALLMRRADWCDGWPFPAAFPFASIGTRSVKLYAAYVPRMSTRKGKGDVALFFGRFEF